jgi:3-methyladenine DNA glycosylase AlkC
MEAQSGIKRYFGLNLGETLADRIERVYPSFERRRFLEALEHGNIRDLELKARVTLIAASLRATLPNSYPAALAVLMQILGPEFEGQSGMYEAGHVLWPVGEFVARYGLDHFSLSMAAIEEITKRHTGEFAVRPFIVTYPDLSIAIMTEWARSESFHVRRLASEGLRPRLPWAKKLTLFIDDPSPVFGILDLLKDDPIRYVQRSVANNIHDYLKENRRAALDLLRQWRDAASDHRRWIIRHALRLELTRDDPEALAILG